MDRQRQIKRIKKLPHDKAMRPDNHQALTDYATQHSGTKADLDEALEAASVEHLLNDPLRDGDATAP
jgi:hypothetical protein